MAFNGTKIKVHEVIYSLEFASLKSLVERNEETLREAEKSLEEELSKREDAMGDRSSSLSSMEYELEEQRMIRDLQRNGQFLVLYAFFENSLKRLSDYTIKDQKLTISYKDLKGSDLDKYLLFYKKVVQLDVRGLELELRQIRYYQKLRNCIAHESANFWRDETKKAEDQLLYVQRSQLRGDWVRFDLGSGEMAIRDPHLYNDFLDCINKFLEAVMRSLSDKYNWA